MAAPINRNFDNEDDGLVGFGCGGGGEVYQPSAERVDRISLALWRQGPTDLSPLFAPMAGRMTTVVLVWPVDRRGYLCEESLAGCFASEWQLSPKAFARLEEVHQAHHLGRHDVWVGGPEPLHIVPCPLSLRALVQRHRPEMAARLLSDAERVRNRLVKR